MLHASFPPDFVMWKGTEFGNEFSYKNNSGHSSGLFIQYMMR